MRRISALVLMAAVAVLTSACFASGGSTGSSTEPVTTRPPAEPGIDWTIRYSIGYGVARQDELPERCPADSRCNPIQLPGGQWVVEVTRKVSCPTGDGDATPPADCDAINHL